MKQAQTNLDKWSQLLNTTGGAFNPDKCYWYLISHVCNKGIWEYDKNGSAHILSIPLPDGSRQQILQLPVLESKKMLGVWSLPDGSDTKHLQEVVVGKTRTWVSCIRNSNLPTHLVWKSYRFQLGPAIRFGLANLANQSDDIDNILHGLEFEMLSSMGINQHVKIEWRKLAKEFGRIGLFNLTIKQFIGWAELILQHYGTGLTISKKMRASLVAAQLEIGCNGNPLN
jgi:hypothetical protein